MGIFDIWIGTHSSKAHQYFRLVLNRGTLTAINISRRLDISWGGALHLFTSSLARCKQANPSEPSASPYHPFVAWCCCNYSLCSCTLPAWLCISLTLRVTSVGWHRAQVQGVPLSPVQSHSFSCCPRHHIKPTAQNPQQYSNFGLAWTADHSKDPLSLCSADSGQEFPPLKKTVWNAGHQLHRCGCCFTKPDNIMNFYKL